MSGPSLLYCIALSEARRTIGWLIRHFGVAIIQGVATYFHRDASIVSRRIHNINPAERMNDGAIPQLSKYIRSLRQA